jgi:hypothetical protein
MEGDAIQHVRDFQFIQDDLEALELFGGRVRFIAADP